MKNCSVKGFIKHSFNLVSVKLGMFIFFYPFGVELSPAHFALTVLIMSKSIHELMVPD